MSAEQAGRSRRSSLSFKSITRMLSRDGRGSVSYPPESQRSRLTSADMKQKKRPGSSNDLRRAALASAVSLTLQEPSAVTPDTMSQDHAVNDGGSSTRLAVEDMGSSNNILDASTKQKDSAGNPPQPNRISPTSTTEREQTTATSERCNSPTEPKQDDEAKSQKKESKRLQKEKKEMEKQLRRTEDAEEKRESRSAKRESRRLSKKQPLRSSSRSSSVKSAIRSSTTPVFSSFRRSISGSRASSSHGNPTSDTPEQAKQAADTGMAPTLSGAWPERFGAAVSRELASGNQPPYSPYSPLNHTERSLHSTGKFSDLRASARISQIAGTPEKPRVRSMDVSFYQRQLSSDGVDAENSDGSKETKPNEGYRKSLVDPYTLIPYDTADAEPEQRSEQRSSGTPRFYANLHNIEGLAGSESTLKGVARRCPSAYVAPGDTKQNGRPTLSSSNSTSTIERSTPKYPSVKTNSIWAPSRGTSRTESNRYTAVFKSSSTPVPSYSRENSQRNSLLPSRLRSKHTRFTSSPLATSSIDSPELESNLGEANKSAPMLLSHSQSLPVNPRLPDLECGGTELFPSIQENSVNSTEGVNLQSYLRKPSPNSPESRPENLSAPTSQEPNTQISENKAITPLRSQSSAPVPRNSIPKQARDLVGPARSQTFSENSHPSRISTVNAMTNPAEHAGRAALKSHPHFLIDQATGISGVDSEETTSERYSTASENASNESEAHGAAVSPRSPSPTFNLFGNGAPPPSTVPQTHKNRASLQADHRPVSTPFSAPSAPCLPANSSASLRQASRSNSIAKTFVICCKCNFWHDMPSNVYAKLAPPSRPDARQIEYNNGAAAQRRSSENKSVINVNGSSSLRAPVEANTAMKVSPNTSNEQKIGPARGNDGKSRPLSYFSGNFVSAVNCCWCDHGMGKSCCAGWATTVYMNERHH